MKSQKVSDYMVLHPATFVPNMTIEAAVELFLKKPQIGGPVLDDEKRVIGFLSEQDCLASMLHATYLGESHVIVADKMRSDVLTVSPDDSILEVAKTMTQNKPKVYPVVDKDNKMLGIISRHDVLDAICAQLKSNYQQGHARLV